MEAVIFIIYSIPLGMLLYTLINNRYRNYFLYLKTICSFCFLCLSFYCAYKGNNLLFYKYIFPAFFFCFLGDIIFGIFNKSKRKRYFLLGTIIFLIGHIVFLAAFYRLQSFSIYELFFPIVAVSLIAFLVKKKKMQLGKLLPFAYIYGFFVAMLFSKSTYMFIEMKSLSMLLLNMGSFLFMISDLLILFLYFYRKRRWATHGFNIVTYYYGIFLMVLSLQYLN